MNAKLIDSHMHTKLCNNADGFLWQYVDRGWNAGLDGVIFACHSPMPKQFSQTGRMREDQIWDYIALVDEAADSAPGSFDVRLGLESDYFPGAERWLEELHSAAGFHYILGSIRWQQMEYQNSFLSGDMWSFICLYFDHLAEAAESGLYDCLSHPDHIKRASPYDWDSVKLKPIIAKALDRIANTGVAMELSTYNSEGDTAAMCPSYEMLAMMKQRDIPVVLGSGAHSPDLVGSYFDSALEMLQALGYEKVSAFENRERQEIDIIEARSRLEEAIVCPV